MSGLAVTVNDAETGQDGLMVKSISAGASGPRANRRLWTRRSEVNVRCRTNSLAVDLLAAVLLITTFGGRLLGGWPPKSENWHASTGRPRSCLPLRVARRASARIARARSLSGAENASPVFIREAGTVHVAASRSISRHVAPRVSPVRVAVRMRNSSASAAMPPEARRRFTKAGTSA